LIVSPETCDILVVGGGPAGLAAAAQAAAAGLSVTLVDERVTLGGQIYKQPGPGFVVREPRGLGRDYARGRSLGDAARAAGAEVLLRTSAVAIEGEEVVIHEEGGPARVIRARRRIIAAGASDRPVAFPGWTLPGVITAGGAQTLVKTQRVLPGRRIVFAGAGPVALAFPAQLHHYGANVALVCEAGPPPGLRDVAAMASAARGNAELLRDAVSYRLELMRARIPLRYRRIVVAAEGDGRVEAVVHAAVDPDWRVIRGTEERVPADTLCLGYGFVPSIELLRLAGCEIVDDEDRGGPTVALDEWMRTSVDGVLAAGDGTGVEGALVAVDEGRLAGLGAALELGRVTPASAQAQAAAIRQRLARKRAFRAALARMHRVGPGIYELADDGTVVCRCEEVTRSQLDTAVAASADIAVVKGLTRAGMGLCQGRNCQRQIATMIAARHGKRVDDVAPATPRTPVRPVPLGAIADASIEDQGLFVGGR
jgi:D-hydroxyproline dehydrogenase subunit alpha